MTDQRREIVAGQHNYRGVSAGVLRRRPHHRHSLRGPRCGWGSLTRLRMLGDYNCGSCGLAFGVSAVDLWTLKQRGRRGELVRDPRSGKLWLRPLRRLSGKGSRDLP